MGVPPPPLHAENKLFNAARPTVTLLVEGHLDLRFWRARCVCQVRACHGRARALAELDQAAKDAETCFLAVLDADFDRLGDGVAEREDVVWTDAHDLETTLLLSPVLEKLSRTLAGDPATSEARWRMSFRERLFLHGAAMGRLRWLQQRASLGLVFKKVTGRDIKPFDKYARCVGDDWSPALPKIVDAIIDYSGAPHLKQRNIAGECAALPEAEPAQLCNGHDLVGFLAIGLQHVAGSRDRATLKKIDDLADRMALAYEDAWLRETAMWRALRAWEQAHPRFRVFRRDLDTARA